MILLTTQSEACLCLIVPSEILSQPDNFPIHARLFGQWQVVIPAIQWVKDVLPPELLELP